MAAKENNSSSFIVLDDSSTDDESFGPKQSPSVRGANRSTPTPGELPKQQLPTPKELSLQASITAQERYKWNMGNGAPETVIEISDDETPNPSSPSRAYSQSSKRGFGGEGGRHPRLRSRSRSPRRHSGSRSPNSRRLQRERCSRSPVYYHRCLMDHQALSSNHGCQRSHRPRDGGAYSDRRSGDRERDRERTGDVDFYRSVSFSRFPGHVAYERRESFHVMDSRVYPEYSLRKKTRSKSPDKDTEPSVADDGPLTVISVLRMLSAIEDLLGSLGPKALSLLSKALAMEMVRPNAADDLLLNEDNCVFMETVKEKLKGILIAELLDDPQKVRNVKKLVVDIAAIIFQISSKAKNDGGNSKAEPIPPAPIQLPFDRNIVSSKLASALVDNGYSDVSSEESHLHMKEKNETSVGSTEDRTGRKSLTDSELQVLLQSFKLLSSEEHVGLIQYLRKLEVQEPMRVEFLRKYVNLAELSGDGESCCDFLSRVAGNLHPENTSTASEAVAATVSSFKSSSVAAAAATMAADLPSLNTCRRSFERELPAMQGSKKRYQPTVASMSSAQEQTYNQQDANTAFDMPPHHFGHHPQMQNATTYNGGYSFPGYSLYQRGVSLKPWTNNGNCRKQGASDSQHCVNGERYQPTVASTSSAQQQTYNQQDANTAFDMPPHHFGHHPQMQNATTYNGGYSFPGYPHYQRGVSLKPWSNNGNCRKQGASDGQHGVNGERYHPTVASTPLQSKSSRAAAKKLQKQQGSSKMGGLNPNLIPIPMQQGTYNQQDANTAFHMWPQHFGRNRQNATTYNGGSNPSYSNYQRTGQVMPGYGSVSLKPWANNGIVPHSPSFNMPHQNYMAAQQQQPHPSQHYKNMFRPRH